MWLLMINANSRENEGAEISMPKDHIQIEVKSKDEKGCEKKRRR